MAYLNKRINDDSYRFLSNCHVPGTSRHQRLVKQRPREVSSPAQGHTARHWSAQIWSRVSLVPPAPAFPSRGCSGGQPEALHTRLTPPLTASFPGSWHSPPYPDTARAPDYTRLTSEDSKIVSSSAPGFDLLQKRRESSFPVTDLIQKPQGIALEEMSQFRRSF